MNTDDFFPFVYPTLYILGGLLCLIPAFVAYKRKRNFWLRWLCTMVVFETILFHLIRTEQISKIVYSPGVLVVASLLSFLPKITIPAQKITLPNFPCFPKITIDLQIFSARNILFFLGVLVLVLVLGGIEYSYVVSQRMRDVGVVNLSYTRSLAMLTLIACLGYLWFILAVAEKPLSELIVGVTLTFFFAFLLFLKLARSYLSSGLSEGFITNSFLIDSVLRDLFHLPFAGIFLLVGACLWVTTVLLLVLRRFGVSSKIIDGLSIFDPAQMQVSKNLLLSVPLLAMGAFCLAIFRPFISMGEAGMFLWPFVLVCVAPPMYILGAIGLIISSLTIGACLREKKPAYAFGILLCGILATRIGANPDVIFLGAPLIFYGLSAGTLALVLRAFWLE